MRLSRGGFSARDKIDRNSTGTSDGEQSDATEFSMLSHLLNTQPLEPADRQRSSTENPR